MAKRVKKNQFASKNMLEACNDSLNRELDADEYLDKLEKIEKSVVSIYEALGIPYQNDHNSKDSPRRIAKMFINETLRGLYSPPPELTFFENTKQYDQLINVGPIQVRSLCAHHWRDITGVAYVGILPNLKTGRIIGLSKIGRIVRWYSNRFQIQEELTAQIADFLEEHLEPAGLGVRIIAKHACCSHRGLMEPNSVMDTIIVRGVMRNELSLKSEFLDSCKLVATHTAGF